LIDHVSFRVTAQDAQDCASFYELLGFERVEPPAGLGQRSIWLTRDGSSIHLMFAQAGGIAVEQSDQPGGGHFAIVVERYEAVIGALITSGVPAEERTAYWGSPRCYTQDPAGNKVELMASAPKFV
jgi:catechol 2,3-dioxygenase-like lactoylglutathione lyase family enzyme